MFYYKLMMTRISWQSHCNIYMCRIDVFVVDFVGSSVNSLGCKSSIQFARVLELQNV